MPFYYMTLAKMHLLNGDVEGATRPSTMFRILNTSTGAETMAAVLRGTENVEEACLSSITQWVQELYDDANYTGEPSRDELKTMLKSALDGVDAVPKAQNRL